MSTSATYSSPPSSAKRVVLRLRVCDFDVKQYEFPEVVKKYLAYSQRPSWEYEEGRHFIHIEPFQQDEVNQTSFHITLDMEKDSVSKPNLDTLPHEVVRVRRNQLGELVIKPFSNPHEARNFISKMRVYTDRYKWGEHGDEVQVMGDKASPPSKDFMKRKTELPSK